MITQQQIEQITREIVNQFHPEKIILFGSFAHGTPGKESDLDLLIIKESSLSSRVQNREVRKILSRFKIPVDVVVKSKQEFETYKDIIGTIIYPASKFGKVLYESR